MRTIRNITMLAGICVLAALAVGAVAGAFRPSNEARELLTSRPWMAVWCALCGLLVAGFVVFGAFRQRVGIAAMHLGCVLVIGGTMWGSRAGHELQRRLGRDKAPLGYAIIVPGAGSAETPLYDSRLTDWPLDVGAELSAGGLIKRVDELPFELRLEGFRTDLYPPETGPWLLLLDMFFPSISQDPRVTVQAELDRANRQPMLLPKTDITLRVVSSTPAEYDGRELVQRPVVEVELVRGERREMARIEPEQGASRVGLPLVFLYHDSGDWFNHNSPAILLTRPGMDVPRNFLADVSVHSDGEQVVASTISVNHPLHYGGYHFYFAGAEGDHVLLMATSDSGWLAVWVGFVCVTGGAAWRLWLVPVYRAARRRAGRRRAS